jgi:hypothetical protein
VRARWSGLWTIWKRDGQSVERRKDKKMKILRHTGTFGNKLCLITLFALGWNELSAEPPTVDTPLINSPSVSLGAAVSLAVRAATGTPPLSYQWQLNGEDIDGAPEHF